jgi:shikimate kinase
MPDQYDDSVSQLAHAAMRAARLDRHIAFIGFMGAGKSTFAALTAERLGRPWFDTDEVVARRAGRSIQDLFTSGEEPLFRRLEHEVIEELLDGPPAVLSLGGGALEDDRTRSAIFARAFVVSLAVSWRDVQAELPALRVTRPLLQGRSDADIHELFLRRQRTYRQAHMRISLPRGEPSTAVEELLLVLGR